MNPRVFAPAKINLTLQVGRPRADSRHPLQSMIAFADVGDWVEAAPAAEFSLHASGPFASAVAADDSNLVLRAARALAAALGEGRGAVLRLTKNLPVASGIGGGSSDAAATLKALNALWGAGLGEARLCELARALGADVPVCVGARGAYMTGTGEDFAPLDLPELDAVLVNPLRPLATAAVYRQFDAMKLGADFHARPPGAWRERGACLAAIAACGNDLEAPARALMPELAEMRALLAADTRVRQVGLSGSGATLFALADDRVSAQAIAAALQRARPLWWIKPARLGALDAGGSGV
jgi:4-diphosphocytidyl-2-C-methyl-D-erythritol kinase